MAECLADGKSFVVDNTNPKKSDRKREITPAKKEGYRVVRNDFVIEEWKDDL